MHTTKLLKRKEKGKKVNVTTMTTTIALDNARITGMILQKQCLQEVNTLSLLSPDLVIKGRIVGFHPGEKL
jgi:hypothetical protein